MRGGINLCYFQNNNKRKNASGNFHTLTFEITFINKGDTVYFAHSYPYTYSDLCHYLHSLEADPRKKEKMVRKELCQTLAGNVVDVLVITNFNNDPEATKQKKGIVLTARIHAGETYASWMIKGIIDMLTGPTLDAKILRDNFIFKIVPMLNPDGVVVGNTRCCLSGDDMNRCWIDPNKKNHSALYYTKLMVKKLQEERDIFLYCDFHAHSRKKNVFVCIYVIRRM